MQSRIEFLIEQTFDTLKLSSHVFDTGRAMSRIFAYCRVSTVDQSADNQRLEIAAAGFQVEPRRLVAEAVSGSVSARERRGFAKLLDRLEAGDVLVVTKLDRLGRNAMDIRSVVDHLATLDVRVHCLALGGVDLTSPAGRMTMGVIAAVAEFERDLLIERTQSGLARAKAEGRTLGRPSSLNEDKKRQILEARRAGVSMGALARQYGVSRSAIQRVERGATAHTGGRGAAGGLAPEAPGGA